MEKPTAADFATIARISSVVAHWDRVWSDNCHLMDSPEHENYLFGIIEQVGKAHDLLERFMANFYECNGNCDTPPVIYSNYPTTCELHAAV